MAKLTTNEKENTENEQNYCPLKSSHNIFKVPVSSTWACNVAFSLALSEYQFATFANYINRKAPQFLEKCANKEEMEKKVVRLKMSKLVFLLGLTDTQVEQLSKIKTTIENSPKYQQFVDKYEVPLSDNDDSDQIDNQDQKSVNN